MSDIETRLQQTFRSRLDPISVPGTLPRHVHARARAGRAAAIAAMAVVTVAVVAATAIAVPNLLGDANEGSIGPAESSFPIAPKENGRIAYSVTGSDGVQLHSMKPDGTDDRVIPTPQGDPWLHSWSPDGARLAATMYPRGPGDRSIWVMDADGSDALEVASAENVSVPAWSPDGRSIVYTALQDGRTEIHVVETDGTGDRIVRSEEAHGTFAIFSAQFSPDGTKILFDRGTDAFFDIYVMDATGGEAQPLTHAGTDYDPSWSPDGTKIAFTRQEVVDNGATSDIFVMDSDGNNVRRLTDDGGGTSLYPTWAPDGTKIAYNAGQSGGPGELAIINADTAEREALGIDAQRIVTVQGQVLGVSWQPVPVPAPANDDDEPAEEHPEEAPDEGPQEEIPVGDDGCPISSGEANWTSPTAFVASGSDDGTPWVFCARTATPDEAVANEEGLCINFAYGRGPGTGMDCAFSYNRDRVLIPLDENHFSAIGGPEWGYFIGAAPTKAASVVFESDDGSIFEGDLYPAPQELGVPFQFFTLFGEPHPVGTLIVRDADGDVLRRWKNE